MLMAASCQWLQTETGDGPAEGDGRRGVSDEPGRRRGEDLRPVGVADCAVGSRETFAHEPA